MIFEQEAFNDALPDEFELEEQDALSIDGFNITWDFDKALNSGRPSKKQKTVSGNKPAPKPTKGLEVFTDETEGVDDECKRVEALMAAGFITSICKTKTIRVKVRMGEGGEYVEIPGEAPEVIEDNGDIEYVDEDGEEVSPDDFSVIGITFKQ